MKKTNYDNEHVSKSLREVWEWKDATWSEVKHLPFDEAVQTIVARAHSTAVPLGFHTVESPSTRLATAAAIAATPSSHQVAKPPRSIAYGRPARRENLVGIKQT